MDSPAAAPDRSVAQRTLAFGCLASLGGWLALAAAISLLLHFGFVRPLASTLGVALFAGALAWFAIGLVRSSLQCARERSLVRRNLAGQPPEDGSWVALVGKLVPLGPALVTPLDGRPSIAYSYEVGEHRGSSRNRTYHRHFRGVALAPAEIHTPAGSFRLLVVPELEADAPAGSIEDQIAAFRRYHRATDFSAQREAADLLLDQWSDADGSFRSDVANADLEAVALPNCAFHQHSVPPNVEVALFGRFSAERRGLVPSVAPARLLRGSAEQVIAALGAKVRFRAALGLLLAGAAVGLATLFVARS